MISDILSTFCQPFFNFIVSAILEMNLKLGSLLRQLL